MGRKRRQADWQAAISLCSLSSDDVEMAKRLGFQPEVLIWARPQRKQFWKLPVNEWIRELHWKRFGQVLGQKHIPRPVPVAVQLDPEELQRMELELYWEDYWCRNDSDLAANPVALSQDRQEKGKPASQQAHQFESEPIPLTGDPDDDLPF